MLLSYSIREGLASFKRARFAALTATSAMAVALVLIGLFAVLGFEARQVSNWVRQRVSEVEIFLDDDIEEPVATALFQRARATPGVVEAEYVSWKEAQAIFQEEFGEGAEVFLDEPFLPASVKVRVAPDYANPDSLTRLAAEFGSWNRVDEVVFNQSLLVKVQQNLRLLVLMGLSLGILVVLAAVFLVANTIRLTIYARRLLIRTMKLVGATDAFVRRPFIVEGIVQGFVAGLAAGLILMALYGAMVRYLPQLLRPDLLLSLLLVAALVVGGSVLGWLGSLFAVHRFIKNVALH